MAKNRYRQAVVVIHGMGEQVPMETVRSFVKTAWNHDLGVIETDRPTLWDEDAQSVPRRYNSTWSKPDPRTGLYETWRITTEKGSNDYYADFFEYYWAHLVYGTTWEQVRAWILDLLWRNPRTRVPRDVRFAWCVLWLVTLAIVAGGVWSAWPKADDTQTLLPIVSVFTGGLSLVAAWFVSNILVKRFGDVVRYTKAEPPNVARREEIRRKGVKFLQSLIDQKADKKHPDDPDVPYYDRIVVVAHSLGTIVAYDILSECFAANARALADGLPDDTRQTARAELEEFIRHSLGIDAMGAAPDALDVDRFQQLQDAARREMNAMGGTWQVSDFITLGSPLTHAEFLMADSQQDLRARQKERMLATCPPALEYDGRTGHRHFSYRAGDVAGIGTLSAAEQSLDEESADYQFAYAALPRWPHHAAVFAYTRWTNIFSQHRLIVTGDIVSGPLQEQFGMDGKERYFCGIKDVAVMPKLTPDGNRPDPAHKRRFVSHNDYWAMDGGTERRKNAFDARSPDPERHPDHIRKLRDALRLGADDLNG